MIIIDRLYYGFVGKVHKNCGDGSSKKRTLCWQLALNLYITVMPILKKSYVVVFQRANIHIHELQYRQQAVSNHTGCVLPQTTIVKSDHRPYSRRMEGNALSDPDDDPVLLARHCDKLTFPKPTQVNQYQDEIQSAHWQQHHVSFFTVVLWHTSMFHLIV